MAHPFSYDDSEMVTILEKVTRDIEALYRWDLAEQDVARPCPDCDPGGRAWCDVHRCRTMTARGTRCKRRIGDDLLHCGHHAEIFGEAGNSGSRPAQGVIPLRQKTES